MAIIEPNTPGRIEAAGDPGSSLVHWIVARAGPRGWWASSRDTDHDQRWEEYYRLWRGIWSSQDKSRASERSRLIAPALQQAIESVVSEIESAVLDRASFFDVVDDIKNRGEDAPPEATIATPEIESTEQKDMVRLRKKLYDDMMRADYDLAMAEIFLNGAIFGTGIGKINIEDVDVVEVGRSPTGERITEMVVRPQTRLVPILPQQFTIDTAARRLSDAMGYAHTYGAPRHDILAKQRKGVFRNVPVGKQVLNDDPIESDENFDANQDSVNIIDYRGLVPRQMLVEFLAKEAGAPVGDEPPEDIEVGEDEFFVDLAGGQTEPKPGEQLSQTSPTDTPAVAATGNEAPAGFSSFNQDDLVEAFVIIANEQTILKAEENTFVHKDRLVVAYRHEIVPDQFWGRGAAEKGYNSQKALDASLRARIDGLALTVHPMMAMDASRMPRGFRFKVSPGRNIFTTGDPNEILRPINFGQIDPNIFTDNAELERMVAMATGGMDTAAPVKVNNRNETASGMSMQLGSFVKRSKRTIRNVEKEFVVPLVQQTARLYMQVDPERYPMQDYTFRAISVLGTMARELEQTQFAMMINTVPENSPAFWMLMKSFYQASSLSNREDMIPMIDDQLNKSVNPPPPQPTPLEQVQIQQIQEEIKTERAKQFVNLINARVGVAKAANEVAAAPSERANTDSETILNLAKAEAEESGTQLNLYKAQQDALEAEATARLQELEDVVTRTTVGETQGPGGSVRPPRLADILGGAV